MGWLGMNAGKFFINGQWVSPTSGKMIDVVSPSDGQVFAQIADGDAADIELAVSAARESLDGEWGTKAPVERGRILHRLSLLINENAESRPSGGKGHGKADDAGTCRYNRLCSLF